MTLRLKLLLALIGASLLGVLVAFAGNVAQSGSRGPARRCACRGPCCGPRQWLRGTIAGALTDLQLVIRRFIKWDMDGEVPHAARADEVGDIAKALKAFQTDAIKWSEMHRSEQDSQVQLRLAAQQPTEELIHQFRGGGVSFGVARELQTLLPRLKEQCSAEDYQDYARGIAGAIHGINTALIDKAVASHPELAARIEAYLAEFGRVR
jgi:hypothetical protein